MQSRSLAATSSRNRSSGAARTRSKGMSTISFHSYSAPLPALGTEVMTVILENFSIVMIYAFSQEALVHFYDAHFHGDFKFLQRAFSETPQRKATRALVELAGMYRLSWFCVSRAEHARTEAIEADQAKGCVRHRISDVKLRYRCCFAPNSGFLSRRNGQPGTKTKVEI